MNNNLTRARRLFEKKWNVKFKIGDVWGQAEELDTEDSDEFDQFKSLIMPKLRRFLKKMETFLENEDEIMKLDNIVDELEYSDDAMEWDYSWEDFYDWADDNSVWVDVYDGGDPNKETNEMP